MIIESLVAEANSKFAANLSTTVIFDREAEQALSDNNETVKTIIMVGSSHANYLATALVASGYNTLDVETKHRQPNTCTVAEVLPLLEAKKNLLAILHWFLDSAAYYTIAEDSILPLCRDSGHIHAHGELITNPTDMLVKSVAEVFTQK
jgi:hypothetical protein